MTADIGSGLIAQPKEEIEEKAIKDFYEGKIPLIFVGKPLTKAQQQHIF